MNRRTPASPRPVKARSKAARLSFPSLAPPLPPQPLAVAVLVAPHGHQHGHGPPLPAPAPLQPEAVQVDGGVLPGHGLVPPLLDLAVDLLVQRADGAR